MSTPEAEATRLHQQRVLEALNASFPHPLTGNEDAHARKRWANLVNARLKIWPFDTLGVASLFDVALTGRAWNEYQQFSRARPDESDKDYSARLVEHFLQPPKLKTAEVADFMKRLQGRKIGSGESLEDFFYKLQKEISRLNWEGEAANDLLISTFVGVLPPNVQLLIKARDKVTPKLALEIAQRTMKDEDASIDKEPSPWALLAQLTASQAGATGQAAAAVPEPSITTRDVESIVERTMSAHATKVDELTASLQALTQAFQNSAPQSSTESSGKSNRKKSNVNSIQTNGRTPCQICGGTNHKADRCWQRGNGNTPANKGPPTSSSSGPKAVCQLCDSPGHIAKECNFKPPVVCHRCGQTGHISRQCSQPYRGVSHPQSYQPRYGQRQMQSPPQGAAYPHPPPNYGNNWGNNGSQWGNH